MRNSTIGALWLGMLIYSTTIFSQESGKPLTNHAFARMMTNQFNYTILGTQTPTTGFKVETTKPSVAIKGNIYSNRARWLLVNLELEGGLDDKIMNLVSGKAVSSYFKGNLGFNVLLPYNFASFYKRTPREIELYSHAYKQNRIAVSRQIDTFCVVKILFDDHANADFTTYDKFRDAVKKERTDSKYDIAHFKPSSYWPGGDENAYWKELIMGIFNDWKVKADANPDNRLASLINPNSDPTNTQLSKKMSDDYDRLAAYLDKGANLPAEKTGEFEVSMSESLWTWKALMWVNGSFGASNNSFKLYNGTSLPLIDSNSFLPSVTGSFNWLIKFKESHRFYYLRAGISFQRVNSLVDQKTFDYRIDSLVTTNGPGEIHDNTEGKAYLGAFKEGRGRDIFIEFYAVPWKKPFVPGLYLKTMFRYGKAWINQHKHSLDIGMIWNVSDNDKEAKNVLSLIPYISWSNLKKEYKDPAKTEAKKRSDLFSFGIKFGIPVNLQKKS